MIEQPQISYRNCLLQRLSRSDLDLLEPHLVRVDLPLRTPLENARTSIEDVYFMEDGIASVVAKLEDGGDTEVGLIGFEGMTGALVVLGGDLAAHDTYMQIAGSGFRLPASALVTAMSASVSLKALLLLYVQTLFVQTGYTALANARLKLDERLARWLLMCQDRVRADKFAVTHEFVAVMLGVRRPGVTIAIQELEGMGLIKATRGEILILKRDRLVELAGGAYSEPERDYERLLGRPA
jgi:CRP-like cAMP-binding protein